MENPKTEFDNIEIGTKEAKLLSAVLVKILGHRVDAVEKDVKKIGDKVVLIVKHPDREEHIEISAVKYLKGDKLTTSGLWFNLDEDKLIPKQSALAETMRRYGCKTLSDFDGKEVETDLDGKYLVIKAY